MAKNDPQPPPSGGVQEYQIPAGQVAPLPPQQRQVLETKAKTLIADLDKTQPQAPPSPPKKKKTALAVGLGSLALLLVGGGLLVGIRLLQTQQAADVTKQAYPSIARQYTCDHFGGTGDIEIQVLSEEPLCPQMAYQACVTGETETRQVTSTTAIYRLINRTQETRTIDYYSNSNFCVEGCGVQSEDGFTVCQNNPIQNTDLTITLEPGETLDVPITRSSPNGEACGSYQTDLVITAVDGQTDCNIQANGGMVAWSLCQTGIDCDEEAPTPTPTPLPSELACTELSMTPASVNLGTTVEFACSGTPTTNARAEFQASINSGAYLALTNATTGTATMAITQPGNYQVRCRWCTGEGATATCTEWQAGSQE